MKRLTIAISLAFVVAAGAFAGTVRVDGAVKQPADIEFKEGMRVRHALELAGGLRPDADLKKVEVVSLDGASRVIDLTPIAPSPRLAEGDVVHVPVINTSEYVFVRGAVSNPGQVKFEDGMTVVHALAASRPYDEARIDNIKVTRNNGEEAFTVNLNDLYAGTAAPLALAPGDTLEVAYPGQGMSNQEIITLVVIGLLLIILLR